MNKEKTIELVETTVEETIENYFDFLHGEDEYSTGYQDGRTDGCEVVRDHLIEAIQNAPNDIIEDQIETIYSWLCDKLRADTQGICKEFREKFMVK